MTTCGSSCVAAVARLLITSGRRSGDITETMLVRWRKAARTVAACEVIIGEPSSVHFGAATAVARSPMSTGAAGDREQALLRPLVEDRLLAADDRQDDRAPEVVAPGRLGDLAFFAREHLLVVDLFDRERRMSLGPPRCAPVRRAGGAPPGRASAAAGTRGSSPAARSPTKVMREDVAIVEHRGRLGDAALAAVGRGAFDHQRVRRDADREDGAERRFADRGREAVDRGADGRMLRRIERPVAHRDQQRAGQCSKPRASSGDSWETWDTG